MSRKKILAVSILTPIFLEVIALCFLPAQIPIHYNSRFQVTAYGSKYMLLVLGIMILIFGSFLYFVYRANEHKKQETVVFRLCMAALLVFGIINLCSLVGAFL